MEAILRLVYVSLLCCILQKRTYLRYCPDQGVWIHLRYFKEGGIDDEQNSATRVRLQLRNFIEYGVTQVEVKLA
jgi:hypothetical protein